jgi:hypothetical protein
MAPLKERAYFTRAEVCRLYGLSDKRLAEAVNSDQSLPVIRNGRSQIFPKSAFQAWYETAAANRVNVHAT